MAVEYTTQHILLNGNRSNKLKLGLYCSGEESSIQWLENARMLCMT